MNGQMMDFPLTLQHLLERAGKYFGSQEIVSRLPDQSLVRSNYAALYRRSRALSAALLRAGLQRGDRVGVLMWNHAAHLEVYFGVPCAGGVLHTLNFRLHPDELAYIVNHARDRFLIVDDALLPALEAIRSKVNLERLWVVPFSGQPLPQGCESYEEWIAPGDAGFDYPALDENAAAGMCYTSGTTGKPKGVLYSHRAVALHSLAMCLPDYMAFRERDRVLQVSSMFHANGWGFPYAAVMTGAALVFPGPHVLGEPLLDLLSQEKITVANGVPTVWITALHALEQNPERWPLQAGLRVLSAGSAVPASLIERARRSGIHIMQGWGMTETTPLATFSFLRPDMQQWPGEQQLEMQSRQGRPVPFVELRAVSSAGEIPWDGRTLGELQVRGPWVAASYFEFPEAQDRWTADGWFRTGDVVSIADNGFIRIADRAKDLIKSGGEWISSVDLENALMGHPAVREAAVVGVPHPKWAERPLAVVVLRDGVAPCETELREFLTSRFARWQLPDAMVFVPEIPKTSVGKFLKARLREQYSGWKWGDA